VLAGTRERCRAKNTIVQGNEEEAHFMANRNREVLQLLDSTSENQLSRRQLLKRGIAIGLAVPSMSALLAACEVEDGDLDDEAGGVEPMPDDDDGDELDDDGESPVETDDDVDVEDDELATSDNRYGGELRIAIGGEPPSLDLHQSTALVTVLIMGHVYELLFTWDDDFAVYPDLVDTYEVSDDGLLNTLNLRQGVLFHNGNELTADDVHASIDRWANVLGVGFGEDLMAATDEMRVVDDYTLEFEMNRPFGTFAVALARQSNACAIYPQEIVDEAGDGSINEFIGTGPYQFVEHIADQHILVERFEDYVPRDEEPNGYAGGKHGYLDQIRFIPVPDEAARVTGLQADDFDFLEAITTDQFEALEGDDTIVTELGPPIRYDLTVVNMDQGVLSDLNMRRAVQAAIDCEEVVTAAHGADYIRLDPGHMWQETIWHSTAGEEKYNIGDPDLAAEYLEEAGYDGEVIRLMTTQEFMDLYYTGAVIAQQLEDAGMNVDLMVVDWATLVETQNDTSAWDLCTTWFGFRVDPAQLHTLRCDFAGRWCTEEKTELVENLLAETELDERVRIWEELQELAYEEVPFIKTGESMSLLAYQPRVQNLDLIQLVPAFWNTWIDE
jgi:peptide/nickel transport system substrate-binding protein